MKLRKIWMIALVAYLGISGVFAAGNEKGIEYFRAELYGAAKIFLNNRLPQISGTEKAEAYYYLGETYAATEMPDSAAYYYQLAIEADKEYPYAFIGLGKLALNRGEKESDFFKRAIGFAKRDPAVRTSVAEAYFNVKQYEKGIEVLDQAKSRDKNYSGIYVAEGDMLMAQGKVGEACAKYENAIYVDANDKVAYLKEARVYKSINPKSALNILERLLAVDPEYIPAYAELGDIYYNTGYYAKAIEAYAKFISIPGVPLKYKINYASLLYFTKDYAGSLAEINKLLPLDPNNVVLHRLQMYNYFEMESYEQGLEQAAEFFSLIPQDQIIALDYMYYGRLLDKSRRTEEAIEVFKKSLEIDSTKTDVYKEIAAANSRLKNYDEAIRFYELYKEKEENLSVTDLFFYAQTAFSAAQQLTSATEGDELETDSVKRMEYLVLADNLFTQVTELSSESYLGYLWRGNTQSVIDAESTLGLAKPHYEKALEIMEANNADGRRNRDIVTVYQYLGYYYYLKEDFPNAIEAYSKIIELNPEHEVAKQALEILKK